MPVELLETIKCKDGKLYNLEFHQQRFDLARRQNFPAAKRIKLSESIQIPEKCRRGLFRCRVLYEKSIEKIEFHPHQFRKIEHLKLVVDDEIDYRFKYSRRQKLEELFEERGDCDDILIVKNGCITDSFTANPIFFDGKHWWTPDTPLLAGTQRAHLLENGIISACKITPSDILKYQKAGLINALQSFEDMPVIDVKNISMD